MSSSSDTKGPALYEYFWHDGQNAHNQYKNLLFDAGCHNQKWSRSEFPWVLCGQDNQFVQLIKLLAQPGMVHTGFHFG